MENSDPIEFFDPHFHIWDIRRDGCHDPAQIPQIREQEYYLREDYENEWKDALPEFRHTGGVFVEAMSVCFTDRPGADLHSKYLDEANFASSQLPDDKYRLIASVSLEAPNCEETLD